MPRLPRWEKPIDLRPTNSPIKINEILNRANKSTYWASHSMRSSALLLRVVTLASLATSAHAATIINFDDIPGAPAERRIIAGDRYQSQGVQLSTSGVALFAFNPSAPNPGSTPPTVLYGSTSTDLNTSFADAPVIVSFVVPFTTTPRPTDFVSVFVHDTGALNSETWNLTIYDTTNQLLDSISKNDQFGTFSFTRPTPDIARLVFTPSPEFESIDNLQFNVVPEPSTFSLIAIGVAATIAVGFRRTLSLSN